MSTKPKFYARLSSSGKSHYNAMESLRPYSERFIELMEREPAKDEFSFTDEEIEFLAKEDLPTLADLFPGESEYYMNVLSD